MQVYAQAAHSWTLWREDPPVLLAPLDIQLLPGSGDAPTWLAVFDPASNRSKVQILDLDGHPVLLPGPRNGPDPWSSGLRPFAEYHGPQLPLAAWRGGAYEAIQAQSELLSVLQVETATGLLLPLTGRRRDALHPGEVPFFEFEATWWGCDPRDGTLFCAGEDGVWQLREGKETRLPIQPRQDWLALETGPDGTFALASGPGRESLQWTIRLYDADGTSRGTCTPAADLTGKVLILDQANAGLATGFLLLAEVQAPYPVSLTQYLNDATRVLLRDQPRMVFAFRFNWGDGRLAALTPLPDLPADADVLRLSADSNTAAVLVRNPEATFVRLLAVGNLAEIGDVPLTTGLPALAQPAGIAFDGAGQLLAVDQVFATDDLIPLVLLKGDALEEPWPLLPLPDGSRLDLAALTPDSTGQLWWGGQIVDTDGVLGSVWQLCDSQGTLIDPSLFHLLPSDLFALDAPAGQERLPWVLAQTALPEGGMLVLAGTFDPPQHWLLQLDSAVDVLPETLPLPDDLSPLDWPVLELFASQDGTLGLCGRNPQSGAVQVWKRERNRGPWQAIKELPSLGAWPLGIREGHAWVWCIPGLGLAEVDQFGRLTHLAANPSPFLGSLSQGVLGGEQDALLIRQLGQVWGVPHRAYDRLRLYATADTGDAQLALYEAMQAYFGRTGSYPAACTAAWLAPFLRETTWERVWEHFIGGRPLLYQRTASAYDLVVWTQDDEQAFMHISEQGIRPIDPVEGFIPADKRGSLREVP